MNVKELIKKYEYLNHDCFRRVDTSKVLRDLKQLDEPEKVKIPQFIADWIEECKAKRKSLLGALLYTPEGVNSWVGNSENQETFALAWLFGYEVEKKKRYRVKMKGMSEENTYLTFRFGHTWMLSNFEECEEFRLHHTRKEIEDAGFGEVFNSTLFEVEEVEE